VPCATADPFHGGGDGCKRLAATVIASLPPATPPLSFLYANEEPLERKLHAIATRVYGADGVSLAEEATRRSGLFQRAGFHSLPVCMAKTHQSLTDDPDVKGRPQGFRIKVRDFEIANGAGFVVALTGQIMRMPALPRRPAAEQIDVTPEGVIVGL
jgi:formate--tetrahydrofolate ligase